MKRVRRNKIHIRAKLLWLFAACFSYLAAAGNIDTPAKFIKAYESQILQRLKGPMREAGVPYPPKAVRLAVFKAEKTTELWLPDKEGRWRYVKNFAFSATSGGPGPRIYAYDNQIPEGIYGIDALWLSAEYHLALHMNHPNEFDKAMALLDGRDPKYLSDGINVHGGAVSYGCVVIGNKNIEELFLLSYHAGMSKTQIFVFPHDTDRRTPKFKPCAECPVWYGDLLTQLSRAITDFQD